jgi:hypothetical protein
MRTALYRIHYGFEFIYKSIESVYDWADRIVIVVSKEPWFKEPTIEFQDKIVELKHPEDMAYHVRALSQIPKVEVYQHEFDGPNNQWGFMLNNFPDDYVLTVECDMVFPKPEQLFEVEKEVEDFVVFTNHCEYWKNEFWRVQPRPHRPGPVLVKNPENITTGLSNVPRVMLQKGKKLVERKWPLSKTVEVDNYGFCYNPAVMFYKHVLCYGFSKKIGDSPPDPNWYDKWYNWTPATENLEISQDYAHTIKRAYLVKENK